MSARSATFEARYDGRCAECGGTIRPGQVVAFVTTSSPLAAAAARRLVHDVCPDPLPPARSVCSVCREERSAAGTCRCDE